MVVSNQLKNQHLIWRAGFGPKAEDINNYSTLSQKELFKKLLKASSKSPQYIDVANNSFDGLMKGLGDAGKLENLTKEQKQEMKKQNKEGIKNLNLSWVDEMINSDGQLREKMAFFWHGHFACRNLNMYFQQLMLDTIRRNALGNFADLLREVSKSSAMLAFLNNQQNKKQHPNENFAREVMELFTMGRGNYSELDVKEAARAFTGWGFKINGEFVFREQFHDTGTKTFMGKSGNLDGDDILDILLDNKKTSYYITKKIYRFFVNDKPDEQKIIWLADRFYKNNYEIKSLLEDIFTSEWFYAPENIGTKIKSPVELLVGFRRMLPMELANEDVQLLFQKVLGQILFYPPNVAGWPGGKNWIDSSALMVRLRIPRLITDNDEFNIKPKTDDDQQMGQMMEPGEMRGQKMGYGKIGGQKLDAKIEWNVYLQNFQSVPKEQLISSVASSLLQKSNVDESLLMKYSNTSDRESFVRSLTINIMSMPEYQLC
ncbi:MAG: DUF1800 domain-containing protein [Bacteroidetes bacterium]|nr:MAG: DUF1800 domain-containing protein [Bacteroidota bacterium]